MGIETANVTVTASKVKVSASPTGDLVIYNESTNNVVCWAFGDAIPGDDIRGHKLYPKGTVSRGQIDGDIWVWCSDSSVVGPIHLQVSQ